VAGMLRSDPHLNIIFSSMNIIILSDIVVKLSS